MPGERVAREFYATPETIREVVAAARAAGGGVVHLAAGIYSGNPIPELLDFITFVGAAAQKPEEP